MYKIKNIVYSDAGKVIKSAAYKGYQCEGNLEDFEELTVDLNTGHLENGLIVFDNTLMLVRDLDYVGWKTHIVKIRYSNDDQIAIILNKDSGEKEDILRYNKMQEWREYAGELAHKILEILNINNN